MLRLRMQKSALFGGLAEQGPRLHAPLAEQDGKVLLRSRTDPRVRRWQRVTAQVALVQPEHARRVLNEAFDGGGTTYLTRARAERPEVRALVDQGLLELHAEPAHHAFDFRAVLTKAGRAHVKRIRDAHDRARKEAQTGLFKGGRVRFLVDLRKASQVGLFGGAPGVHAARPTMTPSGTVAVHQHLARNPGGGGVHVVTQHERKIDPTPTEHAGIAGRTVATTKRGHTVEVIPRGLYEVVGYEDRRPIDFDSGKRLSGSEDDAVFCHRCDKKHWRVFKVQGPAGTFDVGESCAKQMLEGFDPTGEQHAKMIREYESAAKSRAELERKIHVHTLAAEVRDAASALEAPPFVDLGAVETDGKYKIRRYRMGREDGWSGQRFDKLDQPWSSEEQAAAAARWRADQARRMAGERESRRTLAQEAGTLAAYELTMSGTRHIQTPEALTTEHEAEYAREVAKQQRRREALRKADGGTPGLALRAKLPRPGGKAPAAPAAGGPQARGLQLVSSKQNPRVKRWERQGEPVKPASDHVAFRHPETGEERTGQVLAGGAKGVTVADHETGLTHKVAHGHYVVADKPAKEKPAAGGGKAPAKASTKAKAEPAAKSSPTAKAPAQAPAAGGDNWRETHPGLNKYPPPGVTPDEGGDGDDWKLRWRSPGTGKMVQAYETAYLRKNAQDKFRRITTIGHKVGAMRETTAAHMKAGTGETAVKAAMLRMVDLTSMRAGNEDSAGKGVHGVSTLLKSHVKVSGDTVKLDYVGKSSVPQQHELHDPQVAAIVKHLLTLPGDRLFQFEDHRGELKPVTADALNDYVRTHLGEDHTLKDLRTFHATRIFSEAADKLGPPKGAEDAEEKIHAAALEVAKQLGHKKASTRKYFAIHDAGGVNVKHVEKHGGKLYMHGERRAVGFHTAAEKKAYIKATGSADLPKSEHPEVGQEWLHEEQTSLDNYIDPTVVEAYRKGLTLSGSLRKGEDDGAGALTPAERRFLDLLGRVEKADPYKFRGAQP